MSEPLLVDIRQLGPLETLAYGVLAPDGAVLDANRAFSLLLRGEANQSAWNARPHLVEPSFDALLQEAAAQADATHWTTVRRGLMHVGDPEGIAQTLRGIVLAKRDTLLIVAEPEHHSVERLARDVLALNGELSEAHRDQARVVAALHRTERDLRAALADVRTLAGLLPICARCKAIRNDEGYWERIEQYLEKRTHAQMSHSLCKDCLARELAALDDPETQA